MLDIYQRNLLSVQYIEFWMILPADYFLFQRFLLQPLNAVKINIGTYYLWKK